MEYFVISDIHGYYKEMCRGLRDVGFQKNNPNHMLIVCGDIFDRGPDAMKVYKYIRSIPKARRVLVRGNHESLFQELLEKKYPQDHDFHNRTVDTFCQLADRKWLDDSHNIEMQQHLRNGYMYHDGMYGSFEEIDPGCQHCWNQIRAVVKKHPITRWLRSKDWVDYYELDRFIFVHSFIPTKLKDEYLQASFLPKSYLRSDCFQYDPEWRSGDWEDARWGCPYRQFDAGLFGPEVENGKVLVCGHWHTSDFHRLYEGELLSNYDIYFGDNLIAIDGCTALTEHCNVLKIDDQFICYDKYGKLSVMKEYPYVAYDPTDETTVIKTVSDDTKIK